MGFFDRRDRKRRGHVDDFDSPVEEIDLDSFPAMSGSDPDDLETPTVSGSAEAPAHYGVDQAIQLLQSLPTDNLELVVQVVKQTLASMNISVGAIIQEATIRLDGDQRRGAQLTEEIAQYERGIAERRAELAHLATDFEQVTMVRDRLLMAERANLAAPSTAPAEASLEPTTTDAAADAAAAGARPETVDPDPDVLDEPPPQEAAVETNAARPGRPSTPPPIPRGQALPSVRRPNQAAGDK